MAASFQRETTIDAAPSAVFSAITDPDRFKQFMPDLVKVQPLTDRPMGEGFRWKETRTMKLLGFIPLRASATVTIDQFEPGRSYRSVTDDGCNWAAYTFTVDEGEEAGTSHVQLTAEFRGVGKYEGNEKVADKLAAWCEKSDGDLLLRIKSMLEGPSAS